MKINMKQWSQSVMESGAVSALPLMSSFGASLGCFSVREMVTDGEKQAAGIRAISDNYDLCALVTMMDLSVEAQAFGCEVSISENEIPSVSKGIVNDKPSAVELKVPDPLLNRTSVYIKAANICSANIGKPVFGCLIGPFSLAGRLMDMTSIFLKLFNEPDTVHAVLEKCAAFLLSYASAFKEAGASGILMAEPAGSLISPAQCSEFSSLYIKKIVETLQDDHFTVVLHNCGKTLKHVETMLSTGAGAVHFGNAVDLSIVAPQIPSDILFMGNLDPVTVFVSSMPAEIEEKTRLLLEAMKTYRNFIISSGCDIPPGTQKKSFDAFFNAVSAYNKSGSAY